MNTLDEAGLCIGVRALLDDIFMNHVFTSMCQFAHALSMLVIAFIICVIPEFLVFLSRFDIVDVLIKLLLIV